MNKDAATDLTLMPRLKSLHFRGLHKASINSFYHLPNGIAGKACHGTACFVARHLKPDVWKNSCGASERVYCLGKCYAGPASDSDKIRPCVAADSGKPV